VAPSWVVGVSASVNLPLHHKVQKFSSGTGSHGSSWKHTHTHTHHRFTAHFQGPPGLAGARRELLDFMVQGKINRGRHADHPAGCHSIRTN